ncbi:NitT/TauT family transport system ATP-binding protein [Saccharomonospora amisosensis]|uniref:NitT/TauT family transport system ATP-binding protein n=1 Tax=Saccharomonospora amisosensis TaxID=1128677 RepID=A0A7X5UQV8_9PSEU|nr:ABC transporter ATP-binding protein [Saccharomonospora amisosensis]NIJ12373.1 NitT/TauT family transport system ATP-binding protein [Saccharomonospora amisosensis]NIJ12542.1 NitT/TauT family transport system ATP-binding protein [Saccharomonospora amisosensis]
MSAQDMDIVPAACDPTDSAPKAVPKLELVGVDKEFRSRRAFTHALADINLTISDGEFVSVIGRSGCGKTTLLRMLAGLLAPTTGQILVEGRSLWNGTRVDTSVVSQLGVVFQDANLFPWYSVADNIALPLKLRGDSKTTRRDRAHELADLVGLTGYEKAYPRELSGGMRQRVAIARALSTHPTLLLMDEPFGALDALTRERMNLELQHITHTTGATVVFITHDITEAVFLGDRVIQLTPRPGRIADTQPIPFPRPRHIDLQTEPHFGTIARHLRHALDGQDQP